MVKNLLANAGDARDAGLIPESGRSPGAVVQSLSHVLRPHELQNARLPCPSLSPEVCSSSCPESRWCHPTISSSVAPFSSCPQSFPALGSFPMSQLFTSGGPSIGVSASVSVLPMYIQGRFPLGLTGLNSLLSKGLSRVFSGTTVWQHQSPGVDNGNPLQYSCLENSMDRRTWNSFHISTILWSSIFCQFLSETFDWVMKVLLYILDKFFFPSLWLVFHSLNGIFWRAEVYNFNEAQFTMLKMFGILFLVPFLRNPCLFHTHSLKVCTRWRRWLVSGIKFKEYLSKLCKSLIERTS